MVSATRRMSCRTEVSRSCVLGLPWKYLLATMLVAVCDQLLGTSTFSWRKMVWPFSLLICAVRRSHSTASNGAVLPSVKNRANSSPLRPGVCAAAPVFPLTVFWFNAIRVSAISPSAQEGSPAAGEPCYFTPRDWSSGGSRCLILQQAPLDAEEGPERGCNFKKKTSPWQFHAGFATGVNRLNLRRSTGAGEFTPSLSRLDPGRTAWLLGWPSRCCGAASGPNHVPPNLGSQYYGHSKNLSSGKRAPSTKYMVFV